MSNFYGQKFPIKFRRLILRRDLEIFENVEYLPKVIELYMHYSGNLVDDFSPHCLSYKNFIDFLEKISPHFYLVFYKTDFCGFITLENLVGDKNRIHSAEVSICLKRKYWGKFALIAGQKFKNYCFNVLKIYKLKALIYTQNKLSKNILNKCGFKMEAVLKSETVKNGKPQDIEVYTLFNTYKGGCNAV